MDCLPPLAPGFVRITVLLRRGFEPTHGSLAQACRVDADELGPVWIEGEQASVDVRAEKGRQVRERLDAMGTTQVSRPEVTDGASQWSWLRLQIGRNHGMTMGLLRKVLDRAEARPVGRIKIANTHTLIGLRGDRIDLVEAALRDAVVNGCRVRPQRPAPDEIRMRCEYEPSQSKQAGRRRV